ncbi:hypothetical protein EIP91_003291 [Steccherinum ochraceum]|uniref:Uncharacterized protein n=1 Tax=Steccherinum ochraceum TaxID=92696 RepID=A0A4R0REA1_9APHY|nr:hypothetical protein EIP91_003291 [Steccherinum ochraceum]
MTRVQEPESSKRKLSVTAGSSDASSAKKVKATEDSASPKPANAELKPTSGDDGTSAEPTPKKDATASEESPSAKKDVNDKSADNGVQEEGKKKFDIAGPGPYTFFFWGSFMTLPLEQVLEENESIWLKDACMDAWSRISAYPEEEREEIVDDHIGDINRWEIVLEDDAWEDEDGRAEALSESYEEQKDGDAMTTDSTWWEIDLQRAEPEGDGPAVKVDVDEETWWATAVRQADKTGQMAMEVMSDFISPML